MIKMWPPYEVMLNAIRILRLHTGDQNDVLDCQEVAAALEKIAVRQMKSEEVMEVIAAHKETRQ